MRDTHWRSDGSARGARDALRGECCARRLRRVSHDGSVMNREGREGREEVRNVILGSDLRVLRGSLVFRSNKEVEVLGSVWSNGNG